MSIASALAAAAAVNLPSELPKFVIKFLPHGHHDRLHVNLNINFGEPLPDQNRLFRDPNSPTDLLPDSELLAIFRRIICDEMIIPMAVQTQDTSIIMPLLNAAPMFVDVKKVKHRLNKTNLTEATADAIKSQKSYVEILIGTSHFFIDETSGPITYLDWNKFSTTATAAPMPPGRSRGGDRTRARSPSSA